MRNTALASDGFGTILPPGKEMLRMSTSFPNETSAYRTARDPAPGVLSISPEGRGKTWRPKLKNE